MIEHIETVAQELGIDYGAADDIVYLRQRSRWTQEKEDKLIAMAKAGDYNVIIHEWNG